MKPRTEEPVLAKARNLAPTPFSVIVDAVPRGLVETDHRGHVLYANRTARARGVEPGKKLLDCTAHEDREWLKGALGRAHSESSTGVVALVGIAGAEAYRIELVGLPDPGRVWITLFPAASITGVEKVTARLKTEQFTQLAGSIAHDLNNALTVVTSALGRSGEPTPMDAELTDMAREALLRAVELGRDLQTLAHGPRPAARTRGHLSSAMRRVVNAIGPDLPSGVMLAIMPPGPDCWVAAESHTISRIYAGMTRYLMRGLPPGTQLLLVATEAPADVEIRVSHNGSLAPETSAQTAFDPFATTSASSQAGVGLALIGALIEALGGTKGVEYDSPWTHIFARLPRASAPPPEERRARGGLPAAVLVVDDDDLVRASIARTLRARRIRVVEAPDGPTGLRLLETEKHLELALVDLVMPGMDGETFVRQAAPSHRHVPFIVMSGWARDERVDTAISAGARGFLPKPFEIEDLRAAYAAARRTAGTR